MKKVSMGMVLFLCASCALFPSLQERQEESEATERLLRSERLLRRTDRHTAACREMVLERIRYFPPDSQGRQYPQETLRIRADGREQSERRTTTESRQEAKSARKEVRRATEERRRRQWKPLLVLLALLAGGAYCFRRFRKPVS